MDVIQGFVSMFWSLIAQKVIDCKYFTNLESCKYCNLTLTILEKLRHGKSQKTHKVQESFHCPFAFPYVTIRVYYLKHKLYANANVLALYQRKVGFSRNFF